MDYFSIYFFTNIKVILPLDSFITLKKSCKVDQYTMEYWLLVCSLSQHSRFIYIQRIHSSRIQFRIKNILKYHWITSSTVDFTFFFFVNMVFNKLFNIHVICVQFCRWVLSFFEKLKFHSMFTYIKYSIIYDYTTCFSIFFHKRVLTTLL